MIKWLLETAAAGMWAFLWLLVLIAVVADADDKQDCPKQYNPWNPPDLQYTTGERAVTECILMDTIQGTLVVHHVIFTAKTCTGERVYWKAYVGPINEA